MRERQGRKKFRLRSIQNTMFLTVSALLLSAIAVLTLISVYYNSTSLSANSRRYTRTIIRQMNQNIDSYISYMDNITSIVLASDNVQQFIAQGGEESREQLLEQFHTILHSRNDIKNVGILLTDGRYLINTGEEKVNPDLDIADQSWYSQALADGSRFFLSSSHVQHVVKDERSWVITLCRRIQNAADGKKIEGVVFLDLNYLAISEMCSQNNLGELGYVFILDEKGAIVYHPKQQEIYNELQTENFEEIVRATSEEVSVDTPQGGKMYQISRSQQTGWMVVGCINQSALLAQSRQSEKLFLFIGLGLVALALILSRLVAQSITRPIKKLRSSMEKVQTGDFSGGALTIPKTYEVASLTDSFNIMIDRIQFLMAQNEKDQEEKRRSELMALQSQINPHFLYNTLDSIIWMAEGGKNEEVVRMTASLAKLLRQKSLSEDETITLRSEMDYINSYLVIQKMRYKDKLEYSIDMEPEIGAEPMLRLTVQPIVENAIYHGLKYKEGKGSLEISARAAGDDIVIEIRDDGQGMDEETLAHIFEKHQVNYRSNGIGVYNVQRRLKLYYGERYGLTYKSEKNKGTLAVIRIPRKAGR